MEHRTPPAGDRNFNSHTTYEPYNHSGTDTRHWILAGAISVPTTLLLRQVRLVFASNDCGPLSIRGAKSVRRSQDKKTLDLVAWPRRGPATPAAHSVSLETLRPGSGWLSRWYGSCPTYVVEEHHTLIRLSLQRSEVNLGQGESHDVDVWEPSPRSAVHLP